MVSGFTVYSAIVQLCLLHAATGTALHGILDQPRTCQFHNPIYTGQHVVTCWPVAAGVLLKLPQFNTIRASARQQETIAVV